MYPRRSFSDTANVDELVRTMTPRQMVWHLGEAFLTALGERAASSKETLPRFQITSTSRRAARAV